MSGDDRRKLLLKLSRARKAVGVVEKTGHNAEDGYRYVEAARLIEEANRVLKGRGVLVIPSVTSCDLTLGKSGALVRVGLAFEIIDVDSGYSIEKAWFGTGFDSPGDKALYQAITGGTKYFLAHLLAIPFGADPEAQAHLAGEPSEDTGLRLNVGALCGRLQAAGRPADRDGLALLLGAAGVMADLPEDAEALAAAELVVGAEQLEAIEAEVVCIEQDAAAEQSQADGPEPVDG